MVGIPHLYRTRKWYIVFFLAYVLAYMLFHSQLYARSHGQQHKKVSIIQMHPSMKSWEFLSLLQTQLQDIDNCGVIINLDVVPLLGTAHAIRQHMGLLKKTYKKPIVVYVERHLFNAAYIIACAADRIIASEFADIGAFGLWREFADKTAQDKHNGISYLFYSRGMYKLLGEPHAPFSAHWYPYITQALQEQHTAFCQTVMSLRPAIKAFYEYWAHGQIISASDACNTYNLVDEIGDHYQAITWVLTGHSISNKDNIDSARLLSGVTITVIDTATKDNK